MQIRRTTKKDLNSIIKMWSEDTFGKNKEVYSEPLKQEYFDAFDIIDADPNQELVVLVDENDEVLASLQLTYLQYITSVGGIKALVENVIVRQDVQKRGYGQQIIQWAVDRAKLRGAHTVQLTTNKLRQGTKDFYERLGFKSSHEGMKLHLK